MGEAIDAVARKVWPLAIALRDERYWWVWYGPPHSTPDHAHCEASADLIFHGMTADELHAYACRAPPGGVPVEPLRFEPPWPYQMFMP